MARPAPSSWATRRGGAERMSMTLSFDEVRRALPHSYPMILVDVVEELEPGQFIVCRKNVTGNEWCFPGHFPARAVYPGVLLLEGLAQAALLLFSAGPASDPADTATYL